LSNQITAKLIYSVSLIILSYRYRMSSAFHVDFYSASERCISYDRFCLTVYHTLVSCQNDSSYDHAILPEDSPMTLVSSRLTLPRNSKGNMGSEGAE